MSDPFFERLLDSVFKNREVRKRVSRYIAPNPPDFPFPFITISRDPCSGGAPIGREVATRLNFQFYDRELIEEIAKKSKLRREILEQIDERGRTTIQDMIHSILDPDYISDVTYLRQLSKVILSLAYKGNVVILGRGASFMTPRDRGLHVRITAPLSVRIDRAVMYEGLSPQKARDLIGKHERDRKEFVRQYFDADIRRPEYYDLVVNTEFLDVDETADIIVTTFRRKFPTAVTKLSQLLLKK